MKRIQKAIALSMSKGFTLIELLIVIAVLGVLAVAVLSAINPIEQINRGKDTGSRSDAEQIIGAIDRYYTSKGYYPWMVTADSADPNYVSPNLAWQPIETDVGTQNILENLSTSTGEIKSSFVNRLESTGYNTLYIYNGWTAALPTASTYVCFGPKSKSFVDEAEVRCTQVATLLDYPAPDACVADNEYSCLP